MNVLLLTENWAPRVGGIENYLQQLAEHLPERSVQVVAPLTETTDQPQGGVKAIHRKRFFWPLIKPAWLPLSGYIKQLHRQEKIDIILCGKALFEGLLARKFKQKYGIPYVVFTYAMEIETWRKHRHTRQQLIKVLREANRIVYINDVTKRSLLDLGAKESQLVKIWPGVADTYFQSVTSDTIQEVLKKYKVKQPYVISVARLIPRKGIDTLIQGFSHLEQTKFPDVQLVIAGTGPEVENIQTLIRDEFMDRNVKLLGFVPDADLAALYSGASLFALTPRNLAGDMEGFGLVYIEAAACGLPAIATHSGGASEAVLHKETGLVVQPDSPAAVAEALTVLLSDTGLRARLGDGAQRRAYEQFRWNKRSVLVKGLLDAIMTEHLRKG